MVPIRRHARHWRAYLAAGIAAAAFSLAVASAQERPKEAPPGQVHSAQPNQSANGTPHPADAFQPVSKADKKPNGESGSTSQKAPEQPQVEAIKWTDKAMAASAIAQALFAMALVFLTWRLWVVGKGQHSAAVAALAETKKAADAAVLSAKAIVGVELPTLRVTSITLRRVARDHGRPGKVSEDLTYPRFDVFVKNYGRTPAFVTGEAICTVTNRELLTWPDYSDGAVDKPPSTVIEPQTTYELKTALQFANFNAEEVADFLNVRTVLYVFGYVRYEDFMREPHILRFIYELIPGRDDQAFRLFELHRPNYSDSF